eukprot:26847-Eustigmatos_ZCMA.PRE.1
MQKGKEQVRALCNMKLHIEDTRLIPPLCESERGEDALRRGVEPVRAGIYLRPRHGSWSSTGRER